MRKAASHVFWAAVALAGAWALVEVTSRHDRPVSAAWILVAAACIYAIGYRFYSKWIAAKLLLLDDRRATPSEIHDDGRDFVKTNKWIVFGHHFAAISGPGPLVGPVLAAQFGYLPGALWILVGVVLGGAVQDFLILAFSMRRDGRSLGEMVRDEIGKPAGLVALVAVLGILVILVAVLGLVVVKALAESPWGTFTLAATIPIALAMGLHLRFLRPGKVLEVTVLGVALLLFAVWAGGWVHHHAQFGAMFTLKATDLAWAVILYGFAASVLPVWLLLAPRDYLSTFMKLGTVAALALGILVVMPELRLPPLTPFVNGLGPIFAGDVFPFCFITIACGAISGFHSLIASGTTPKMIARESHARTIGYGSMLLESSVAIMALIAACSLQPGVYFAINSPAAVIGATPDVATATVSTWGYPVSVAEMADLADQIGEKTMFHRAGGAPTLAVGMAHIFSNAFGGTRGMGLWYHFAIMFEALFILTTVDAGTRVGRFLLQAALGCAWKPLGRTGAWSSNLLASSLFVGAWGFFLYQGVVDPLGGINSLWPLFGIANQLLAVIALCLGTTVLLKMGRRRFLWVTLLPLVWLVSVTFTAAMQKIFHSNPRIGFLAQARALSEKLAAGPMPPEKVEEIRHIIFNQRLDAAVAGFFLILVLIITFASVWRWFTLWRGRHPSTMSETPVVWLPEALLAPAHAASGNRVWTAGALFLGLLQHLSGQARLARAEKATVRCAHESCRAATPAAGRGALWAELEDRRFKNPRCC
ncbi:MAG: carbon starvation protein A [Verrucomicrobiae bacterium]|nr:carbon starvation protein A [Verrucomicrobiae bacterium]